MTVLCPQCGSEATRRGGRVVWTLDLIMIAVAVPVVLTGRVHAALVAGIILAIMSIAHLAVGERACRDCGAQWRERARRDDN
ncbi:MAG: hypothetical protein ABIP63_04970 [Thermoanaerobaculia bacterium]